MILASSVAGVARAATLTFDLDLEFSGSQAPGGATPWISTTFDDSVGGANNVRLTMSATNLVDVEFVDDWLFNFDPSLDVGQLLITHVSGTDATNVNTGTNAYMADGDGKFDIQFDFPPPPGNFASKFTAGEQSVYDLTYIAGIDVISFDFQSEEGAGNGTYSTAAHVQGIGAGGTGSGWIGPIPEPATGLLVGAAPRPRSEPAPASRLIRQAATLGPLHQTFTGPLSLLGGVQTFERRIRPGHRETRCIA